MATITLLDDDDLVNAGDEDDIIYAGGGNDTVNAGGGNDTLMGDTGDDLLAGGAGDDQLLGDAGSDRLYGGEGNDVLDGGTTFWTNDFLAGGPGDDTYVIEWNRDAVVEAPSEGVDLIRAAAGNYFFGAYTLPDGVENLDAGQVSGTTVRGNALDNVITGSSGNDQLYGLSGSDHLIGGGGGDTLIGDGEGSDSGQVQLYNVGLGVGGMLIVGEQPTASVSSAGNSVTGLGDVNGDGHADIAVGASSAVYVLFGPFGNNWQINLNDAAAGIGGYKIVASGSEYIYGSVASAGDVNGDGLADLLIANYNDPEGGGGYSGAAFVVFGKADGGQIDLAQVAAGNGGFKIVGEYGNQYGYYYGDWAGYSLSAAGDLNADGNDDVLIGARWNDEGGYQAGAAYVVWGKADGLKVNLDDVANGVGGYKIVGENGDRQRADGPGDAAGESVAGVGDVNGDAIPDLLIGAPGQAASYLVYGKADNGKINLDDVAQGIGGFKISGAGSSVASGGDVNGDGRTDYLIGGSGVSYVVFGSATPGNVSLTEVGAGNGGYALNFGGSPVNLGDINSDGRDDLLVTNFTSQQSSIYHSGVVFGRAGGTPVNAAEILAGIGGFAIGIEQYVSFSATAAPGDVTGDGVPDLLAGSTYNDNNRGYAYLVDGHAAAHVRGDDLIEGRAGDDWLVGGGGSDKLDGGIGTDTADYSGSAGAVMANLGVGMATQDGLGGADTLVDMENLNGSAHADKLVGSALANALYGQSGDDELWAGAGADLLDGGAGDDVLGSDAGADTLTGGAGADHFVLLPGMEGETITDFVRGEDRIDVAGFGAVVADWAALRARVSYVSGEARIDFGNGDLLTIQGMPVDGLTEADFVGLGALGERWVGSTGDDSYSGTPFDDVLDGLAGNDAVNAGGGDDVLTGDTGDDRLEGGAGDDRLEGNGGNDTLDGGTGIDTADYSRALGSVGVDLGAGLAADDGNLGRDTLIDIENVIGSPYADRLIGNDVSNGLLGSFGNDVLIGLGGNDVLDGASGNDTLYGGAGDDRLIGGAPNEDDYLYGGEGNDTLEDFGTPWLRGNTLAGGPGDDTYIVGDATWGGIVELPNEGDDHIIADLASADYIAFSSVLQDNVERLSITKPGMARGNALDNVITGSTGNDRLIGLAGTDHLIGGAGNDTLLGDGEGADSGQVSLYDVGRGVGGVRINGEKANDYAGSSLAGLGDVNGDGHADIAVGASSAVYVLFGPFGNNWQINLNDAAAGIGGYKIVASGSEYIYGSVASAGDVNGDGLADLLIANYNDPEGGGGYSGAAFVVFGKADGGQIDLAQVAAGNGGFKIVGEYGNQYGYYYGDWAGYSLSAAGDLNADGNDDVLIGARWNDEGGYQAGAAYVVWGKADGLKVNLDDVANGVGGYKIVGENGDRQRADGPGDAAGESVAGVGDVNGDAIPDLLIGAPGQAASYLVYGKADNGKINLDDVAQGIGGFKISGAGSSVASGGDVNGDGRTDYLIGGSGVSYVVFGSATPGNVSLTEVGAGNGGYALNFGGSPVNLGDINSDGRDDLLVTNFTSQQSSIYHSGVVFGRAGGTPVNAAEILAGIGGFAIGIEQYVSFSATAAPGDVTGDGVPDLLAGSTYNDNNRGYAYLVDGHAAAHVRGDDLLEGGAGDDGLVGGGGNDTLIGGSGNDVLRGNDGHDRLDPGTGTDFVDGGPGNDELIIDWSSLPLNSGSRGIVTELFDSDGNSVTNPDAATEWIIRADGANELVTAQAIERLNIVGTNADDLLIAGSMRSILNGGAGKDSLMAGPRGDILIGGPGADVFVGSGLQLNADFLVDLSVNDTIRFTDATLAGAAITHTPGQLVIASPNYPGEIIISVPVGLPINSIRADAVAGTLAFDPQDDSANIVWINSPVAEEELDSGATEFLFEVFRSGDKGGIIFVPWRVESTGGASPANELDFEGGAWPSGILSIPANGRSWLTVKIQGDIDPETHESFRVALLGPGTNYGFGNHPFQGVGVILNDDDPRVLSIVPSVSQSEGTDTTDPFALTAMDFAVTRGNASGDLQVTYSVTPGPVSPADSADIPGIPYIGTVDFADGQDTATIRVDVKPDDAVEANETFFVRLGDLAGWTFSNRQSVGTIEDDDAQKVSIVSGVSRAEGSDGGTTPFRFEVTRSNTHGVLELSYGVTGGPRSPADGNDIANTGIGKVRFEDGEGKQSIVVDINRDNDEERNETFFVTLGDPGTGLEFGNRQAVGTIGNDDIPLPPWPRPVFRGDPHLITLDGLAYDFQAVGEFVAMQSPNGQDVSVQVRTAPVGDLASNITAVAMLLDGHRVTLTAGEVAILRIDGVQTDIPLNQGFIAVGGGTVTFDGDAYTLIDPDGAGMHVQSFHDRLDLSLTVGAAFSGNLQGLLGNFNGVPADDLVLADGTVLNQPVAFGDLYGSFADSWRVTMATSLFDYGPGESSATFTNQNFPRQAVTLDMLPPAIVARATALVDEAGITDPTARAAAILDLALTGDMSYLRSASVPAAVTQVAQLANVPTPLPSLSILGPEGVQWEGDTGGTYIRFDVFRSGDTTGALPVVFEVVPFGMHPADAGDFGGTWPTGLLEFADGEGAKAIEIVLSGDTLAEYSEGFAVRLSVSSEDRGRVLLAASSARVTIENDDGDIPARFDIEPAVASAAEGDAGSVELTFSVIRSDNLATEAVVSYAVLGYGRAASADDFDGGIYPAGTLAFLANETRKVISISVASDTDVEFDESFVVWLANPINGVVGAAAAAGSILNDDVPPAPDLAIAAIDAHRPEGDSGTTAFTFVVARTGDTSAETSVEYAVSALGIDAASALDFGGSFPTGTLLFAVGETEKLVTIAVIGDTSVEADETFKVTLGNASNGRITTVSADGTILNDDTPSPPELSIAAGSASKPEGNSGTTPFTFSVTRSGDLRGASTVAYAVTGSGSHSASANDFGGALPSGTISFAANEVSKTVTVDVSGDTTVEPDEDFTVTLSDPSNAMIVTATAEGTIVNDDAPPPPTLAIAALGAAKPEGDSGTTLFSFAVSRTGDTSGVTTVDYSVAGTGAQAVDAADFGGALPSGTLTFAAGEVEQVITIAVTGDTAVEADEQFAVTLSNPGNATLAVASVSATIENDDTSSFKIGDAPARPPRSDAGAWERSWSHAGVTIAHKANLSDANESYSNVLFASSGSGILAGGDVSGGDLGVSGQTLATSAVLQELDGSEGLRFVLDEEANQINFQLSRFTRNDDGTGFNEAGRLQLLDAAGALVKEIFFYADALDGSKQLSVPVEEGFSQAVFSAGAQNGEDFAYGAYGNEAGSGFGSDPYSANDSMHGSEYLIDSVGFTTGYVDLLWAG